jgi:hypothetical protein
MCSKVTHVKLIMYALPDLDHALKFLLYICMYPSPNLSLLWNNDLCVTFNFEIKKKLVIFIWVLSIGEMYLVTV